MVNYKTSVIALLAAATVAVAQNTTIIISPGFTNGTNTSPVNGGGTGVDSVNIDITFTINLPAICPTGLVDVPYVISQHCPTGGCPTGAPTEYAPFGIASTTTICTVCAATPTLVTVYSCPNTPTPTATTVCNDCHTNVVVFTPPATCITCPAGTVTTITNVLPPPATTTPVIPVTPQAYTYTTSTCPGCPATVLVKTTAVPVFPATATVCPGCPKTMVPTPSPMSATMVTPPSYTGAASNNAINAAGLMIAGVAVAALL